MDGETNDFHSKLLINQIECLYTEEIFLPFFLNTFTKPCTFSPKILKCTKVHPFKLIFALQTHEHTNGFFELIFKLQSVQNTKGNPF